MSLRPLASAVASRSAASVALRAIGFSMNVCLPASSAFLPSA